MILPRGWECKDPSYKQIQRLEMHDTSFVTPLLMTYIPAKDRMERHNNMTGKNSTTQSRKTFFAFTLVWKHEDICVKFYV